MISLRRRHRSHRTFECKVFVFEDILQYDLDEHETGESLFDKVCDSFNLVEKDYFGLRILDVLNENKETAWLCGYKSVKRQLKKHASNVVRFRVKHYPVNPYVDLQQKISQYYLYRQLRMDLYSQNLIVQNETNIHIIALILLAEGSDLVDKNAEEIMEIAENLKIMPNISLYTVEHILEDFDSISGLEREEAEHEFVNIISDLESYGAEANVVYNQVGEKQFLTLNHQGICVYSGDKRNNIFYWENIQKMQCKSKEFLFDVNVENQRKLGFKFTTSEAATNFWQWALDRQNFMTLNRASEAKVVKSSYRLFHRKLKHKFSGRTQKELTASCQSLDALPQPDVERLRKSATSAFINRSNSTKAFYRNSLAIDRSSSDNDSFATLPRKGKMHPLVQNAIDSSCNDSSILNDSLFDNADESNTTSMMSNQNENVDASLRNKNVMSHADNDDVMSRDKSEEELDVICEQTDDDECGTGGGGTVDVQEAGVDEIGKEEIVVENKTTSVFSQPIHPEGRIPNGKLSPHKRVLLSAASVDEDDKHDESNLSSNQITMPDDPDQLMTHRLSTPLDLYPLHNHPDALTDSPSNYDSVFLIKFVVLTTLLLLFVMITSLVIYYYYRAATIADLNKQRYESDLNKNVDFDSIKRFILRNDEP